VIGISIISVNAIKPLRELNITDFLPKSRIHHKTHGLAKGLAVVYIMVTIKIEHIRAIGKNCRNTNLYINNKRDILTKNSINFKKSNSRGKILFPDFGLANYLPMIAGWA